MDGIWVTVASLVVAVAGLVWLLARGGVRNSLVLVAGFFIYFAFGPVVNVLRGEAIYFGTTVSQIPSASVGFALAVLGMCAADVLAPQRMAFDSAPPSTPTRIYLALPLVYLVLASYGMVALALYGPALIATASKSSAIAAAGPFHYQYLLIQLAAMATFFMSRQTRLQRRLWNLNFAVYLGYCLVTSERDFLFVVAAVVVFREMLGNRRRGARALLAGVGGVFAGSWLFTFRASTSTDLTAVLNQGSVLFIDTFVRSRVPDPFPHTWGESYVDAALRLVPFVESDATPLSQWLKSIYAPGGASAYGFSMTGEAYLNFGNVGVFFVMLAMGLVQRFAVNRADQSDWWAFAGLYLTIVWLYGIRGDSIQTFSAIFYGVAFFAVLRVTTVRSVSIGVH